MDFLEIAKIRQSCRSYDAQRPVEREKLLAVLEAARLAPSACNSQPYVFTVCTGETAREVAKTTVGLGMNKFTADVPVIIVISEGDYNKSAGLGAKALDNDYRSMDIGLTAAYLTAEAATQGLGTCIIGYFDDKKIRKLIGLDRKTRLVIALGYPKEGDPIRKKARKDLETLVREIND